MPSQLQRTNQEYGGFCGAASREARSFHSNSNYAVTEAQILEEGRRVGIVVSDVIDLPPAQDIQHPQQRMYRGGSHNAYLNDIVEARISVEQFTFQGFGYEPLECISWNYDSARNSATLVYPDETVIEIRRIMDLPAGLVYAGSRAIPMQPDTVRRFAEIARSRHGTIDYSLPLDIPLTRAQQLPPTQVTMNIHRLHFRRYAMRHPSMFPHPTFAIATGF